MDATLAVWHLVAGLASEFGRFQRPRSEQTELDLGSCLADKRDHEPVNRCDGFGVLRQAVRLRTFGTWQRLVKSDVISVGLRYVALVVPISWGLGGQWQNCRSSTLS